MNNQEVVKCQKFDVNVFDGKYVSAYLEVMVGKHIRQCSPSCGENRPRSHATLDLP